MLSNIFNKFVIYKQASNNNMMQHQELQNLQVFQQLQNLQVFQQLQIFQVIHYKIFSETKTGSQHYCQHTSSLTKTHWLAIFKPKSLIKPASQQPFVKFELRGQYHQNPVF